MIRCYGSREFEDDLKLYILLEYADCDFHGYQKKFLPTGMPLFEIISCWKQMVSAVKLIHAANIVHFDLKPANFLLVVNKKKRTCGAKIMALLDDICCKYFEQTGDSFRFRQ